MTALDLRQRTRMRNALRLLTLIEGTADSTSYLESCEGIDKKRVAIRESATQAIMDIELAFHLHWYIPDGGPTMRDGTPLPRRQRAARKGVAR